MGISQSGDAETIYKILSLTYALGHLESSYLMFIHYSIVVPSLAFILPGLKTFNVELQSDPEDLPLKNLSQDESAPDAIRQQNLHLHNGK